MIEHPEYSQCAQQYDIQKITKLQRTEQVECFNQLLTKIIDYQMSKHENDVKTLKVFKDFIARHVKLPPYAVQQFPFNQYLIFKPDGDLQEGTQTVFVYYEPYQRYIYAQFSDDFGFFKVYVLSEKMMVNVDTYIRLMSAQ